MRGSLIVAYARKSKTLYKLAGQGCGGQLNASEKDFILELGHMSKKELHALFKRNTLLDFKSTHLNPCVDCLAGKQQRVSFSNPKLPRKLVLLDLHVF